MAAAAALHHDCHLIAVAAPLIGPWRISVTDSDRFRAMAERFGALALEQGICGCHDAVLLTTLVRALVMTATRSLARSWRGPSTITCTIRSTSSASIGTSSQRSRNGSTAATVPTGNTAPSPFTHMVTRAGPPQPR
jgi:hypothetical protein